MRLEKRAHCRHLRSFVLSLVLFRMSSSAAWSSLRLLSRFYGVTDYSESEGVGS